MDDSEWPDGSTKERKRLAYERIFEEWWDIIRRIEDHDEHPSSSYLADLVTRYGVPDFARKYVARRVWDARLTWYGPVVPVHLIEVPEQLQRIVREAASWIGPS